MGSHMRVLFMLMCLFVSSGVLTVLCGLLGFSHGMHTLSFMAVEVSLNVLPYGTVYMSHAILLYIIHLYDLICEGSWEDKEACIYYTDFMEIGILFLNMMHHIHMLRNIVMEIGILFLNMMHHIHMLVRQIIWASYIIMSLGRFSMATMEELASHDDRCAICLEKMYTAYKLPCGHLFHKSCLHSWLEQDMSCPTCRMSVNRSGSHIAEMSRRGHHCHSARAQLLCQIQTELQSFVHSSNMIFLLQADDSQVIK
uniref:Autocrine motility factor receptor b n=1 Tax=Sinocyclocheilus grahami TaxID=75366 RepID=A0A672LDD8_SINGR